MKRAILILAPWAAIVAVWYAVHYSGLINPTLVPAPHDVAKRYATPFLLKYLAKKNKFGRRLRPADDGVAALIARPK